MFGSKKEATFAERMAGIKSAFQVAHESANNLHAEMEEKIKEKSAQICQLTSEIEAINVTRKEAEVFMTNISKLI